MPIPFYNRQRRAALDQLVEDYARYRLDRRAFLQRALVFGLSTSAATALLAGCDAGAVPTTSVDVLNVWGGEEQASFRAVVAPFERQQQIRVNIESTRDEDALLNTLLRADTPPGIVILPSIGKMRQLAQQGQLIPLDALLDMSKLHLDYTQNWIDYGSYKGRFYAIFYKLANKGTIWYDPIRLQEIGSPLPATWEQLLTLSDQIATMGRYPWSMGVESAATSGWPASDWVAEIYLRLFGPILYDQWVSHALPWTDSSIKQAFQEYGRIIKGKHYINGAPHSILATNFQDAGYAPFKKPPQAYLYYLGDFITSFITSRYPQAQPGKDFAFFPFPTLNPRYANVVTGGADILVALQDNQPVRALIQYLASADAQRIWVRRGGFTSANRSLDLNAYPNSVARASARMLVNTSNFRFGAGDLMPPAVQNAFWRGMLAFISDQHQLDQILASIERVAQQISSTP